VAVITAIAAGSGSYVFKNIPIEASGYLRVLERLDRSGTMSIFYIIGVIVVVIVVAGFLGVHI
jgi:hypothetical protein